ncbi:hypothetical protein PAMC26510_06315 [Caballeronia sordidicola]|uniref:Uncharacterized protein n=1 Tax=Caballeronia sordidicola TaxID=196367 RepID=A0A242N5Z8_CABSO|nr:hypothetical protein PAMC26577_24065 [Caballeronia sordidicola]OTP79071.1 hypothetical protein PAMC26510_06315 [Caballeronia sordidicola]
MRNRVFSHGFFSGSASLQGRYWVSTRSLGGHCGGCCAVAARDFSKHLKNAKGAVRPLESF